jgi:hypothetical protein
VAIAIKCGSTKAQFDATVRLTLYNQHTSSYRSSRLKLHPLCNTEIVVFNLGLLRPGFPGH